MVPPNEEAGHRGGGEPASNHADQQKIQHHNSSDLRKNQAAPNPLKALVNEPFDYRTVGKIAANLARTAANKIRQHERRVTAEIIGIGNDLLKVKEALGHGNFGRWLDAECGWTDRTARNYMRAAEVFGSKSATVSVLPPATVYKLASKSTPRHVVADVIADIEEGLPPNPLVIEAKIETAARDEKEARKKKREQQRRQQRRSPQVQQRLEKQRQEEQERQRRAKLAAQATVDGLVAEFGADVVVRIARALNDWDVRDAVAALASEIEAKGPRKAVRQ